MPKKSTKEDLTVGLTFQKFGQGVLKFFEMLFKFVLDLLKELPAILKAIVWIILVGVLAAFLSMVVLYAAFSAFGIKDSPGFQDYRETVIDKFIGEHEFDLDEASPVDEEV